MWKNFQGVLKVDDKITHKNHIYSTLTIFVEHGIVAHE